MELEKRHTLIKEWLAVIKDFIIKELNKERIIERKSHWNDLVTDVDILIENYLIKQIEIHFPGELILGEETADTRIAMNQINIEEERLWIIDPLDGTLNFITSQKDYAVLIAYYEKGIGQAGYIMDMNSYDVYHAFHNQGVYKNDQTFQLKNSDAKLYEGFVAFNSKVVYLERYEKIRQIGKKCLGVRGTGSAGLEAVNLLNQYTVAYLSSSLMPWDIGAATILLEEAGLKSSDFEGRDLKLTGSSSVIYAYPSSFNEIHHHLKNEKNEQ